MNKYLEKIAISLDEADTVSRGYDNPGWQALKWATPLAVAGGAIGTAKLGKEAIDVVRKDSPYAGMRFLRKHLGKDVGKLIKQEKMPELGFRAAKAVGKRLVLGGAVGAAIGTGIGGYHAYEQNKKMDEAMESTNPALRNVAREGAIRSMKNTLGHTAAGIPNPLPGSAILSGTGAYLTNKHIKKQLEKTRD